MRNHKAIFAFLALLSSSAIYGQTLYFHRNLEQPLTGRPGWGIPVLVSLAIEGISVYLTAMAHAAVMANQAGGSLRLGSYVLGIVMGALNYAHFSHGLRPNATAVTFGMLSSLSPWLWAIYSRHTHRVALARMGLTEPRGVRLSTSRKIWHPFRTLAVYSYASWVGVVEPARAVELWMRNTRRGERCARKMGEKLDPLIHVCGASPLVECSGTAAPSSTGTGTAALGSTGTAAPSSTGTAALGSTGTAALSSTGTSPAALSSTGTSPAALSSTGTSPAALSSTGTSPAALSSTGTAAPSSTGTGTTEPSSTGTRTTESSSTGTSPATLSSTGTTEPSSTGTGTTEPSSTGTGTTEPSSTGTGTSPAALSSTGTGTSPAALSSTRAEQFWTLRAEHPEATKTQIAEMMGITLRGLSKALTKAAS